jgi:hypothetical protein
LLGEILLQAMKPEPPTQFFHCLSLPKNGNHIFL